MFFKARCSITNWQISNLTQNLLRKVRIRSTVILSNLSENCKLLNFTEVKNMGFTVNLKQWKRNSCKQSARWQHLSWLKASAFFSMQQKFLVVKKHYNLYLRLLAPSGG
jgi:hypothetical protein